MKATIACVLALLAVTYLAGDLGAIRSPVMDPNPAVTEIESRTVEFLQYLLAADHDNYRTYILDDDKTVMIGSAPEEWFEGYDAIVQALYGYTEELASVNAQLINVDPKAHVKGSIGWVAAPMTISVTIDSTVIEFDFRLTAIWEKRAGEWKMVQWHDSIPSAEI